MSVFDQGMDTIAEKVSASYPSNAAAEKEYDLPPTSSLPDTLPAVETVRFTEPVAFVSPSANVKYAPSYVPLAQAGSAETQTVMVAISFSFPFVAVNATVFVAALVGTPVTE